VLREACQLAAREPQPVRVAVNVSAVQLCDPRFDRLVHQILVDTGLSPARLELELTETALITHRDRALHAMRRLKALGVQIAVDDFGVGYSSLEAINLFPIDKIKIDRSFVTTYDVEPKGRLLLKAIITIGDPCRYRSWPKEWKRRRNSPSCARWAAPRCRASCSIIPAGASICRSTRNGMEMGWPRSPDPPFRAARQAHAARAHRGHDAARQKSRRIRRFGRDRCGAGGGAGDARGCRGGPCRGKEACARPTACALSRSIMATRRASPVPARLWPRTARSTWCWSPPGA
jgi:hypothetical protein